MVKTVVITIEMFLLIVVQDQHQKLLPVYIATVPAENQHVIVVSSNSTIYVSIARATNITDTKLATFRSTMVPDTPSTLQPTGQE